MSSTRHLCVGAVVALVLTVLGAPAQTTRGLCEECAAHWWLFSVDPLRWSFQAGPGLLAFGTVRQELGPIAVIGELNFVSMLPKTRSGKIMRRVFRAVIADQDPGDVSTIEDEASVEEARAAWRRMRAEIKGGQGDGSAS